LYKYSLVAPDGNSRLDRADPYAFAAEVPPGSASKVWDPSRSATAWISRSVGRTHLAAVLALTLNAAAATFNLRSRATLGMPILLGMTPSQSNRWDGQIYNSQDGHTYSASISLLDPNTLRVQGCFLGFLCGGENWTRVAATEIAPQQRTPAPRTGRPNQAPALSACSGIADNAGAPHKGGLK